MLLHDEPRTLRAPRRRQSAVRLLAAAAVLVAVGLAVLSLAPGLLPDLNPFDRETRDRSQPVLLRSLERLDEYRAATANLQVVVDVERDVENVPSFIAGERTLFVAAGNVDAGVDFRGLGAGAISVSEDRRSVVVRLPPARLAGARLDLRRSRVFEREQGIVDRVGGLFGEDPDAQRALYLLAQRRLSEAARADGALAAAAQRNTREMLERLLGGLGFTRVDVRFAT